MQDLLKTFLVLAVMVYLLRRKMFMGTVMGIGASLLAITYLTPPAEFLNGVVSAFTAARSLEMTGMLMFTMIMENILRKTGSLKRMVDSLSGLLPDLRVLMAAMPAMIGMLPSPGGAVFSAPMVGEASSRLAMSPDQKAFINYWYRHIWEYVSPLYPGIILVSGLTHLPIRTIALANAPFALSVVLWGAVFCFRGIGRAEARCDDCRSRRRALGDFLRSVAPILVTLVLVIFFPLPPLAAMGGVTLSLYLLHRYSPRAVLESLRESVSVKALLLVTGIMVFQEILEITGALAGISGFFAKSQLPPFLIIAILPFIAGVMTGFTIAYVGITFPLILPLMGESPSVGLLAFAFGSGFCGVMLSPVHLCLVLSREYFNADMTKIYHRLWLPSALVLTAAAVPLLLFPLTR